jgi:hypothetical protein
MVMTIVMTIVMTSRMRTMRMMRMMRLMRSIVLGAGRSLASSLCQSAQLASTDDYYTSLEESSTIGHFAASLALLRNSVAGKIIGCLSADGAVAG